MNKTIAVSQVGIWCIYVQDLRWEALRIQETAYPFSTNNKTSHYPQRHNTSHVSGVWPDLMYTILPLLVITRGCVWLTLDSKYHVQYHINKKCTWFNEPFWYNSLWSKTKELYIFGSIEIRGIRCVFIPKSKLKFTGER